MRSSREHLRPGFPWRPRDGRDVRTVGYVSSRTVGVKWSQPKKVVGAVGDVAEEVVLPKPFGAQPISS